MSDLARIVVRNETSIFGGPLHGTEFDLESACIRCGTGARQVGPLILAAARFPRHEMFATLTGEVLVSPKLRSRLVDVGISCTSQVLSVGSGEPLPIYQLIPEKELSPFEAASSAVVRERACSLCGRDGYFDKPGEPKVLVYGSLGPEYLRYDLLATYERFGNSKLRDPFSESVLARPALVCGGRLKRFLSENTVRGIDLEPLVIGSS